MIQIYFCLVIRSFHITMTQSPQYQEREFGVLRRAEQARDAEEAQETEEAESRA